MKKCKNVLTTFFIYSFLFSCKKRKKSAHSQLLAKRRGQGCVTLAHTPELTQILFFSPIQFWFPCVFYLLCFDFPPTTRVKKSQKFSEKCNPWLPATCVYGYDLLRRNLLFVTGESDEWPCGFYCRKRRRFFGILNFRRLQGTKWQSSQDGSCGCLNGYVN